MKIGINKLVVRQTVDSKFSYYNGGIEEVTKIVEENFSKAKSGYRDGVVLVPVPVDGFFSGVVELTSDTPLKAEFSARRNGEDEYVSVLALRGEKLPAKAVDIVLYRHDVLGEDASTESDWEIISINARPTEEEEPLTPMAMARNMLGLVGGTKAEYTAEEFACSIVYWSKRAMIA